MNKRFTIYDLRFTFKCLLTLFIVYYSSFIAFSQTEFAPPKLTCVRNNSGQIELNWQLPASPNPCFSGYEIYTSIGSRTGTYTLNSTIANPLQTTTLLTIPSGGQTVYFYMINRGSCNNPSPLINKTSDTLDNAVPQPVVELQKITIINNHAVLSWFPSQSTEVIAYLIFTNLDNYSSADTVFGRLNTSYTDLANDPKNPITYKIRAFEYCENGIGQNGNITPNNVESKAMILNNPTPPTKCPGAISLAWNAYKFGNIDPISYDVQTNILNAGFKTITNLNASAVSYVLQNFPTTERFCIRIKANLPGNDSSFSNEICFDSIDAIIAPQTDYIRNISIEDGKVIIEYRVDTLATPPYIPSSTPPGTANNPFLNRSDNGLTFNGGTTRRITFEDRYSYLFEEDGLDVNNNIYSYTVNSKDECSVIHVSDTAATLRVNIKTKTNNKADIIWSGFKIDNAAFIHYRLEKIVNGDTSIVGTFPRSESLYKEDLLFDYTIDSLEEVCYRVTAVFTNNNDALPRETLESHSNIICVQPEPLLFAPQAFVPNGHNKTFKPFLVFAVAENYSFQIYDRWYQLLFSTNDVNARWNGTSLKDEIAPNDSYIYTVKFKGKNGKDYTQQGTVMLLR